MGTSAFFGVSDFLGGLASRKDSAYAVTANAHLIGVVFFAVAVLLMPAPFGAADIGWGIAAGVSGGVGVAALYGALARGRMSVVAPVTAALSGALPALFDVARGTRIGPLPAVGLAVAMVAIVIVSASGDEEDRRAVPPLALGLAVLAGVGFSGSFLTFSMAAKTSGLVPVLAARTTSALLLGAVTLVRERRLLVVPGAGRLSLGAGALDSLANVTMISAIRSGPLAVASVLGSLYPVVTILLARTVLGERLKGLQRAGVGLALLAVVLTAWR